MTKLYGRYHPAEGEQSLQRDLLEILMEPKSEKEKVVDEIEHFLKQKIPIYVEHRAYISLDSKGVSKNT